MLLADDSPLLLSSKHTMLAVVEPLGLVGFAVVEPLGLAGTALVLIMVLGGGGGSSPRQQVIVMRKDQLSARII